MAFIIPVDSTGDRSIQVLLGSNLITVRTYWNPTVPGWYMDVFDSAGGAVALGLALVPFINVLESHPDLTRIYGQFRVLMIDNGENDTETSLGDTGFLWWFAPGEWETNEIPQTITTILPFDMTTMYTAAPATPDPLFLDGSWMLDGTYYLSGEKVPA